MNIGVLFIVAYFVLGIAFLLTLISHDFHNLKKKDWIGLVVAVSIPIAICTYVVGLIINNCYHIPIKMQKYVYFVLYLFSIVLPLFLSYIRRSKYEKTQRAYINNLIKIKNSPNTTEEQKYKINELLYSNPFYEYENKNF